MNLFTTVLITRNSPINSINNNKTTTNRFGSFCSSCDCDAHADFPISRPPPTDQLTTNSCENN